MSEREQRLVRWALTALVFAAVLIAAGVAWVTVHPIAGAGVLLASAGVLWAVFTGREHAARISREKAAEHARSRAVSADGFSTPRPQVPAKPLGGSS